MNPDFRDTDWQREVPLRGADRRASGPAELVPGGLGVALRRLAGYARAVPPSVAFLAGLGRHLGRVGPSYRSHEVPEGFFGINVAPGPTAAHDEFTVRQLADLGVRAVRVNCGCGEPSRTLAPPFVERLAAEGFDVLLNVIQPAAEAVRMGRPDADRCWREFLESVLGRLAPSIRACEIGSAVNRFSWSGHTNRTAARAARIADEVCRRLGVRRYGPNDQDFEPFDNAAGLSAMRAAGCLPEVHTDNLFVDRAGQPENYDARVGGETVARRLRLDVAGKARLLAAIGCAYGLSPKVLCTYTNWTLNVTGRPRRRYVTLEQYARYLVRFCAMGAACGHMEGLYWGALISYSKGLVDDGTSIKPMPPAAHHVWRLAGRVEDYAMRPGFFAYRALVERLSGTFFRRRLESRDGTYIMEFERTGAEAGDERVLVAWTRDGLDDALAPYVAGREGDMVRIEDMYGRRIECSPDDLPDLTASPLYVTVRGAPLAPPPAEHLEDSLGGIEVPEGGTAAMRRLEAGAWCGAIRADLDDSGMSGQIGDPAALFARAGTVEIAEGVAEVPLPELARGAEGATPRGILRRFPPRFFRRGGVTPAARAWNNACRMLSRTVPTPMPLALLEARRWSWRSESFLLVERPAGAVSLGRIMRPADESHPDVSREDVLRALGAFLRSVHGCGVLHGDLTLARILVRMPDGAMSACPPSGGRALEFFLDDTGRAGFRWRLGLMSRLRDLARLRLARPDARTLLEAYSGGRRRTWWLYRLAGLFA